MRSDLESLVVAVPALASTAIAIGLWDRHWVYRSAPILCGTCYGFIVAAKFGHTGPELVEDVGVETALGILFFLCAWDETWVERRRNPQKLNTESDASLE